MQQVAKGPAAQGATAEAQPQKQRYGIDPEVEAINKISKILKKLDAKSLTHPQTAC